MEATRDVSKCNTRLTQNEKGGRCIVVYTYSMAETNNAVFFLFCGNKMNKGANHALDDKLTTAALRL